MANTQLCVLCAVRTFGGIVIYRLHLEETLILCVNEPVLNNTPALPPVVFFIICLALDDDISLLFYISNTVTMDFE